ncbi:MAG: alpha-1,2-fucosyltransferase [Deltaproteobacteria bacterium]|jgi:hypothetical protein|nr:alpha-1,2-fucosyltransferase [Deltaproteobacteria bacterium]
MVAVASGSGNNGTTSEENKLMVIVRLMGGLGNQMFQYSAARRLAYALNAELKLDLTWFKEPGSRPYVLSAFNIAEDMASPREILTLTIERPVFVRMAMTRLLGIKFYRPKSYVKETSFAFDPCILTLSDGIYLDGYWQSEKYFADVEQLIRTEFTLRKPLSDRIKSLAEATASCNSVSIHVRRGDYLLKNKIVFHGVCTPEYYNTCVDILIQRITNPHFFVFSDDPPWAIQNLKVPCRVTFLEPSLGERSFEDLWLMSTCRNHIIANSSFSWWGAWLSNNPDKAVIAPRQWFRTTALDSKDIVPERWLKI